MTYDARAFRDTLGLFVTGVTIITTVSRQGQAVGITANSFNSVSLDPPLVLWSIAHTARSLPVFRDAEHFAVHILREEQQSLSQRFAQSADDKFSGLDLSPGHGGVPLLKNCAACLECKTYAQHEAGDHILFLAEVIDFTSDKRARPLVYHGGRYAELADIDTAP